MTYEINNGWIVGKLPGPNGDLIPVKHFPQGPYERRSGLARKLRHADYLRRDHC